MEDYHYCSNERCSRKNVSSSWSTLFRKNQKGRGLLLGGAPGVEPGNVVILGGGVVGENAAINCNRNESKSSYS